MSLPPIGRPAANRPSGGLPPISGLPLRRSEMAGGEPAASAPDASNAEVLVITVEEDKDDANNLAVIFEGAGFDIENDQIILDILDLAARTYGYKLVMEEDS